MANVMPDHLEGPFKVKDVLDGPVAFEGGTLWFARDQQPDRERLEHGWLYDGRFLCDGCNVRPNHEHRCFRGDATWADPRQVCACEECNQ